MKIVHRSLKHAAALLLMSASGLACADDIVKDTAKGAEKAFGSALAEIGRGVKKLSDAGREEAKKNSDSNDRAEKDDKPPVRKQ